MKFLIRSVPGLALAALLPSAAFASCGAAFCSVNSNWTSESAAVEPGSSLDLHYEFIDQNQPRSGTNRVGVGAIPQDHDEVRTINRNLVATYNHNFGSGWGISVTAPLVNRDHQHIRNDNGTQEGESWNFTKPGDTRMVGRYQLPVFGDASRPINLGFTFGLKLPTGKFKEANAAGAVAERSLQPGSGTTDAIAGIYLHQQLPAADASWFVQAQHQQALDSRDGYRPGSRTTADFGYRHGLTERLSAQVQLNLLHRGRDSGLAAEPADSGGRYAFVSPGLSYAVGSAVQVYGYVQLPVYQNVNGVQLTADKAVLFGVTSRF
ncbi:MAG TPA: hypothetical protein VFF03_09220 [Rhodocyclaceae bacterium]|nr:hypothetical protein [Rhodocyclaceae bacterium]